MEYDEERWSDDSVALSQGGGGFVKVKSQKDYRQVGLAVRQVLQQNAGIGRRSVEVGDPVV